ncbi:MAG: c-type cytochrome [Hyphomicrobiaceae bacterium]
MAMRGASRLNCLSGKPVVKIANILMITWRAVMFKLVFALTFVLVTAPIDCVVADANSIRGVIAEHCVKCHSVRGYSQKHQTPVVSAPGLADIANNPDIYTDERLQRFFAHPHFPMAQFTLSRRNIDHLIAFIKSLAAEN